MKTDIWMPFYIKDYLASTSRLTTLEHGIYLLLLFDYWVNGPIPNDDSVILQITKQTKENISTIHKILERYFHLNENHFVNDRIEQEIDIANKKRDRAKINGLKGGRPTKKTQKKPIGYQNNNLEITQTITHKKPIGYSWVNLNHNLEESSSQSQSQSPIQSQSKSSSYNIKAVFSKPTLKDIHDYMNEYATEKNIEINLLEDPENFFDHFESNGWKVGGKTKMKSWKASVRKWVRNLPKFKPVKKEDDISKW